MAFRKVCQNGEVNAKASWNADERHFSNHAETGDTTHTQVFMYHHVLIHGIYLSLVIEFGSIIFIAGYFSIHLDTDWVQP